MFDQASHMQAPVGEQNPFGLHQDSTTPDFGSVRDAGFGGAPEFPGVYPVAETSDFVVSAPTAEMLRAEEDRRIINASKVAVKEVVGLPFELRMQRAMDERAFSDAIEQWLKKETETSDEDELVGVN